MDVFELPQYGFVLLLFVALFVIAERHRKWVRWSIRGVTSLGAGLTVLLLALDFSCTVHAPLAYSPDGKHVAIRSWRLAGAFGPDLAIVKVRNRWIPYAETAYSGSGLGCGDPQAIWLDNNHLLVRSLDWPANEQKCGGRIFGVDIICERVPSLLGENYCP
jgi:hypothetical protein